jgi:hypothetical protein
MTGAPLKYGVVQPKLGKRLSVNGHPFLSSENGILLQKIIAVKKAPRLLSMLPLEAAG